MSVSGIESDEDSAPWSMRLLTNPLRLLFSGKTVVVDEGAFSPGIPELGLVGKPRVTLGNPTATMTNRAGRAS